MNHLCISSLVVRTWPAMLSRVREELSTIEGAEVMGVNEDGKLVVMLDTFDNREAADKIAWIQNQAGVLSATLIYQYDDHFGSRAEEMV